MSTVELRRDVLAEHDRRATELRARYAAAGVRVVNLLSSPGSGKTQLLAMLLARLRVEGLAVAALVGDCATDNDARRLASSGAPVVQIVTDGLCHLESTLIDEHLPRLAAAGAPLAELDVLVIENVGNLVCPTGFDLGEAERWILLSVTEGEDKPQKYPAAFATADVVVTSKHDLAGPCGYDETAAAEAIAAAAPGAVRVVTSAVTGVGLDVLADRLRPHPAGPAGVPGDAPPVADAPDPDHHPDDPDHDAATRPTERTRP